VLVEFEDNAHVRHARQPAAIKKHDAARIVPESGADSSISENSLVASGLDKAVVQEAGGELNPKPHIPKVFGLLQNNGAAIRKAHAAKERQRFCKFSERSRDQPMHRQKTEQ